MPEEVLALLIVISIMTFIFTLVRSSQQYRLKKLEQESGGKSGDSLTTSELRGMIEDAVSDATGPLRDDLESLAARMDDIESGSESVVLEVENEVQEKTVGRAVRQRQR